jgi:hypothetical protein
MKWRTQLVARPWLVSDGADASKLHDQLDQSPQARTFMTSLCGSYNFQTAHRCLLEYWRREVARA